MRNTGDLGPPVETEDAVRRALKVHAPAMLHGLRTQGWWASDGPVLPGNVCQALRREVEALWEDGNFRQSQSVRGGTEYYDKRHVFATEINGGSYDQAPRLVHYTVQVTRELADRVSAGFPDVRLSSKHIGNKLNFCTGEGASFDAHLDIGVAEWPFNRKLTLLIYLNSAWKPELGGELTLFGEGATPEEVALDTGTEAAGLPTKVAPTAGRWVAFWSDRMLHGVEASHAPRGLRDYRASYTIWLCTEGDVGPPALRAADVEEAPTMTRFS